jgi:hypothetical protein
VKEFAGSDDACLKKGATMQNSTAQQLWDAKCLKDVLQAGLQRQKTAQFAQDWSLAVDEAVRRVSNAAGHHAVCRSAACRRARRCVGNTIPCTLLSERELKPGKMQQLINRLYVQIQLERRTAAYERRPPRVTDAVTNYRPWAAPSSSPGLTGRPSNRERR